MEGMVDLFVHLSSPDSTAKQVSSRGKQMLKRAYVARDEEQKSVTVLKFFVTF